jgi:ubiquinone/menaquinone biosynthesis C-methylase UbiE
MKLDLKKRDEIQMSISSNPGRELPSTYFVEDRSNEEELKRVTIQDRLLTSGMKGVLAEQPNAEAFRRVLDVSCGTGGWLIEVAKIYPTVSQLVGVDVSKRFIDFAQAQAEVEGLTERVQFRTMDVLRMLEFPNGSFDLVNLRCGGSYLRTWDWPKLLGEFRRVSQRRGVIRITEGNIIQSSSPALNRLNELLLKAFHQAGHFFTPEPNGLTSHLSGLIHQHGFHNIQTCNYVLEYRAGTDAWQTFTTDMRHAFRTFLPFLRKWTNIPADYEQTYQQALVEMQQPDFVATWNLLTVFGTPSPQKK